MLPHRIWAPAIMRRCLLAGAGARAGHAPIRVQCLRHATTTTTATTATKKKTAATPKKAKQADSTKAAVPTPVPAKKAAGPGPARTAPVQTSVSAAAPVKKTPQPSPGPVKTEAAAQPKVKAAGPTSVPPVAKPGPSTVAGAAAAPMRAATIQTATTSQHAAAARPPKSPAQTPTRPSARVGADTASKEYKRARWSYTGAVVGVPLLLVTSYFLYDRLILGNERLNTSRSSPPPIEEPASASEDGA
ncbi:hypothetical protein RB601_009933 [Gaeumannomyces tritici]